MAIIPNSTQRKVVLRDLSIFFFVSLIITVVLFRGRSILGGGEVGAAFYSPSRVYDMVRWTWNDMFLGFSSGLTPASAPTFALLSFFEKVGIPNFLTQAVFFLFFLILGLFSFYFLAKELFMEKTHYMWFFSALFYQFNLYNIFNIWNRFLPNVILFYSFLPLVVLVYVKGLKSLKYRYALLVSLISAIFSYAVGAPSQSMIFWGILTLLTLYYYFIVKKDIFYVKYFIVCLLSWFLINFWWVSQEFTFLFSSTFSTARDQFFNPSGNISTFTSISESLGKMRDLFLLRHGRINRVAEGYPLNWPFFYTKALYSLVAWTVTLTVLFHSVKKRKESFVSFFILMFIIGLYFSKGNSPPFGEIFDIFFKKLFFLQFFRNPYEKLGIFLPFSLSILFGLTVGDALNYFRKRKTAFKLLRASFLTFLLGLVGFPFFSGLVFTSENPPANDFSIGIQVVVPDYYKEADSWFSSQCEDCRFIAFPLSSGEGMFYEWPKGYVGLEQSGFLFTNPGISHSTTIPYYRKISTQLERLFINYKEFYKVSSLLNSKHILLRSDINFKLSGVRDPELMREKTQKRVSEEEAKLFESSQFGKLKFFEIADDVALPKIYASTGVVNSDEVGRLEDVFVSGMTKGNTIVTDLNSKLKEELLKPDGYYVVGDTRTFQISESTYPIYTEAPYIFPYVKHLPSYSYYPLLLVKEKIERFTRFSLEGKTSWDLLMLGKRLQEARMSVDGGDFELARLSLDRYKSMLPLVFDKIMILSQSLNKPEEIVWREQDMFLAFSSHLYLLNQFETTQLNNDKFISDIIGTLKSYYAISKVAPFWDILESEELLIANRTVYQFRVEEEGEYELFLPKTNHFPESFSYGNKEFVQIDNKIVEVSFKEKDKFISLGKRHFDKGLHEIGIGQKIDGSLVNQSELSLKANNQEVRESLDIQNFDSYSDYNVSFDYFIRYGSGFEYILHHNIDKDSMNKTGIDYYFDKNIGKDVYWHDKINFSEIISPHASADKAEVIFRLKPWNNCEAIFKDKKSKCEIPGIREPFNKPSNVEIYNLSVTPRLPGRIYLVMGERKKLSVPESVTYIKINPTKYKIDIKNASAPFLLVFSESYDSRWTAFSPKNARKEYIADDKHLLVNGYANAWWVNETGDSTIVLEFLPQRLLKIGYSISLFGIFTSLLLIRKSKRDENKH